MTISKIATNGSTMITHFMDLPFGTSSVAVLGTVGGLSGGFTAGAGALLGLNAENEPVPVEGTGTAAGTGAFAEEGAARLLS
jgi:hypothetical protein